MENRNLIRLLGPVALVGVIGGALGVILAELKPADLPFNQQLMLDLSLSIIWGCLLTIGGAMLALRLRASMASPSQPASKLPVPHLPEAGTPLNKLSKEEIWQRLTELGELYTNLVELSPCPVGVYMDGYIKYVNPAMVKVLGAPDADAVVGQLATQYIHPDSVEKALNRLQTYPAVSQLDPAELKLIRLDGRIIWVEARSRLIRYQGQPAVLGMLMDITDRRRAEIAMRDSEARYRALVEKAIDGFFMCEMRSGQFFYVNPSMVQMLGYPAEELYQMSLPDVLVVQSSDDLLLPSGHAETGRQIPLTQCRGLKKDGQTFTAELTAVSVMYEGQLSWQGSLRDVSERIQMEEHLRQAQKLEAVGRLAGGVAHDFNNLLTALLGYTRLTKNSLPPDHKVNPDLTQMEDIIHRAADLTRQLLTFARRQIVEFKILDLNTVIQNTQNILKRLIGEDIEFTVVTDPNLPHIRADAGQLEQVIVNLAVNARDAMPNGGKLIITSSHTVLQNTPHPGESNAHISPERPPAGHYVQLSVADTGTGISEAIRELIFEPFFTTKETGKGTGLGLAMCLGIVKQHNGYLELDSVVEQGTVVRVYLPVTQEEPQNQTSPHQVHDLPPGSEYILLVEDEDSLRQFVERVLTDLGYQVTQAADGREAANFLKRNPGKHFDLLLSDVVMPHLDGVSLVSEFAKFHPQARVILMSGYNDSALFRRGLQEGDYAFLFKPFAPEKLAQKVREVLDAKNQQN